jgi:hypothetical protein
LLNELIGTKFRPVLGYPGNSDITLAIQRGELHGVADKDWRTLAREHPEWLEQNFVVPLLLLTTEPQPALPDVPLAINYAKDETDRAIMRLAFGIHEYARAFSMASGVPEDRVAAMRAAFESTVVEPDFVTEAETQLGQTLAVKTGEEIAAFVRDAYALPEEVQERVARYAAVE